MKRLLILLVLVGQVLLLGCASARRYLAPREEDYASDEARHAKERANLPSDRGFFATYGWIFTLYHP